ncbi:MAG: hypothetical protein ABIZ07_08465 [Dermatophilaceae bacterium]
MDVAASMIDFALAHASLDGHIASGPVFAWLGDHVAEPESEAQVLDAVSLEVAQRYSAGEMTFRQCDEVMSLVWSFCCRPGHPIPDLTHEVFEAFDQGEYDHGDGADPEARFTKPMIRRIVNRRT